MFPPQLYYRLLGSELVDAAKLDAVLRLAYRKFGDRAANGASADVSSDDAASAQETAKTARGFRPDVSFEGDELAEYFFAPASKDILDDFERFFLEDLRAIKAINSWQASQLAVGHTRFKLGGYRIVKQLGQGGYGQVFLGRPSSNSSNRARVVFSDDAAIKVLPLKSATRRATAKFLREIEISKHLKHPNIVRFIDASKDASVHFAVYEYCDGGDARRLLTKLGRLHFRVAVYLVSEAAKALAHLHAAGLVHRDVKPANLLLTKTGEAKLGDFGFVSPIAKFSPDEYYSPFGNSIKELEERLLEEVFEDDALDAEAKRTFRQQIQGTPDYLAPDQMKNPERPSPLWDVYSLGCAFYYLLTGVVPFPSNNSRDKLRAHFHRDPIDPSELDPSIPRELSRLTKRMMAKEPEKRVATAQEVVDALEPWIPRPVVDEMNFVRAEGSTSTRRKKSDENFWSEDGLRERFGYSEVARLETPKIRKERDSSDSSGSGSSDSSGSDSSESPRTSAAPSAEVPVETPPRVRATPPGYNRFFCSRKAPPVFAPETLQDVFLAKRWERATDLAIRFALVPAALVFAGFATAALAAFFLF